MKPFIVLVFIVPFLFLGCKKVQPEMNEAQNVCDCLKEQRSTFFMGELYGDVQIDLDTVIMPIAFGDGNPANFQYINYTYITFSSNNPNALSYEWQVGNNSTTQTTKEFSLIWVCKLNSVC